MNEDSLFQEVLSRSPEERPVFLEQACSGQPDLLAAVQALLDCHEKSINLRDRPPGELDQTLSSSPNQAQDQPTGAFTPESADSCQATLILTPWT